MSATNFRVASWNVNSLRVREEQVAQWLSAHEPDVLCLQETKLTDPEFPTQAFDELGYESHFIGQKTYNGVALLCKKTPDKLLLALDNFEDEQRRFIQADFALPEEQIIRVVNVYVPNGQALDSDKFIYKQAWFKALHKTMQRNLAEQSKVVLVGDFNITPTDLDVHDPAAWRGKIHCSPQERLMLHTLMSTGLYDTYRCHQPLGEHFSWWDYRGAGYRANAGLRIDLILSSAEMLKSSKSCVIDEEPRKTERPSDHTPVVADYSITR
ncbi:MAG: exodeoxyribonuclease III [Pseudomonadota bacterium]